MKNKAKYSVTKKDLEVTWFSGKGGGGQHRNKHQNCCRIKHPETGVIVTGQSHKERPANQKEAINNLANHPKFLAFCNLKLREIEENITLEQKVDAMMAPDQILIEVKDHNGNWVKECQDMSKSSNTKQAVESQQS